MRPMSFEEFWDGCIKGALGWGLAVLVTLSLFGLMGAFDNADTKNKVVQKHQEALRLLLSDGENASDMSDPTRSIRRSVAQDILALQSQGRQTSGEEPLDYGSSLMNQLPTTAETGKPVHLDLRKATVVPYLKAVYWWPGLPLILLVLSVWAILSLVVAQERKDRYVSQLPWTQAWPWVFTILFGPVWWAVMSATALVAWRQSRRERPAAQPEEEKTKSIASYVSYPQDARRVYLEARGNGARRFRDERFAVIGGEIEARQAEVRRLVESVKSAQLQVGQLRAEQRTLEQAVRGLREIVSESVMNAEFDRILALPGVVAVQVIKGRIRLIVRATYKYQGVRYDLGDWRLDFGFDTMQVSAYQLRSGVRRGWDGYPDYCLTDGSFCFSGRGYYINLHLAKGQYLEAIALAVESLNAVNEGDEDRVPKAFYKSKEVKELAS